MIHSARSAPFLRLYALAFFFFSANAMLNVILPLRIEALGASNGELGLMMGAYMFACMLLRPWAGHLIRRYGPAAVLRILLVANGAALVSYAFARLEGYVAARILQGACTAFFSMALQIGIIDALPESERAKGVSLYSLSTYMPTIFGPLIAVGLWDYGGTHGFAAVMLAIALTTGLIGYGVPLRPPSPQTAADGEREGTTASLRRPEARRPLLLCGLLMLIVSVVFGAVSTFIPLYAGQTAYGQAGIFLMIQASVIVICRLAFSGRIPSDGRWHGGFAAGVCGVAASGAALLAAAHLWGAVALYAAAALIGLAQALLYPTLMSYLTFVLPSAARNVGIGLFIAAADLGISMGGGAMGPVADRFSYSAMYAACAVLAVVAASIAAISAVRDGGCRRQRSAI